MSTVPSAATRRALPADERLLSVVHFYEGLRPDNIAQLDRLYAGDAVFKDPFNEVRGTAAIRRIFEHMFQQVQAPRFDIESAASEGDTAFLTWTMRYRGNGRAGREEQIRGCTALCFGTDGRVTRHRDYWDAAEELYEKLPFLGLLMRALRRRLATRGA